MRRLLPPPPLPPRLLLLPAPTPHTPPTLTAPGSDQFLYATKSHWAPDNVSPPIPVAVGSFQSELGCPADWDPACLRSWLEDPSGSGTYTFQTTALPHGSYDAKVA